MIGGEERGQTETLGFILIFSIVIISIGAIYTSGITDLNDEREQVAFDNTQRAMRIFGANVEDIFKHGAPSRATEIKLYENALAVGGTSELRVTVEETATGTTRTFGTYRSKTVSYQSEAGNITYEFGAVVRNSDGSRAVIRQDPAFSFTDESVVLTSVQMDGDETVASTGDTILVVTDERSTSLKGSLGPDATTNYEVTMHVETTPERARAWRDYFEQEDLDIVAANTDLSDGVVEARFDGSGSGTEQVLIRQTVLDVSIEQ